MRAQDAELVERGLELVAGAVDFYVHASPDEIPRRTHDIGLAAELAGAGLAGAVHRHHACSTVERSALVREVTGFPMAGAVEFSGPAGGIVPELAEVGLRLGAAAVVLPMLSGSGWRAARRATPAGQRDPFDYGDVPVVDGDGRVLPDVEEVLRLVAEAGATLVTGYLVAAEMAAVVERAVAAGVEKILLSNPVGRGFTMTPGEVDGIVALGPVAVEVSVHQIHSFGARPPSVDGVGATVDLVRRLGPERMVISSDGGAADGPAPHEILAWGCAALVNAGVSPSDVRRMVSANPAALSDR